MIKQFMKMGGVKTEEEFYAKYPTEESFFEAFPQAQQYIRQQGGGAQDPLSQVIMAVAQQLQIDPNQLAQMLQQDPNVVSQLQQMANQNPQQAAQALMQMIQNSAGQGQAAEQSAPAQPGEMPMDPSQAMQAAYGGSKLNKFIKSGNTSLPKHQTEGIVKDGRYWKNPITGQTIREGAEPSIGPEDVFAFSRAIPSTLKYTGDWFKTSANMVSDIAAKAMERPVVRLSHPLTLEEWIRPFYGLGVLDAKKGYDDKHKKHKEGGDIAFPQAAPMYDNSIYRTFPPNFPRLFQDGGEESGMPVKKPSPSIPTEEYAQAQGLGKVTNYEQDPLASLKKNKNIGSTDGMTVSQIWTKVTGLPWSEAKKQGFTDGSYAKNISLKKHLLEGTLTSNKKSAKEVDDAYDRAMQFEGEKPAVFVDPETYVGSPGYYRGITEQWGAAKPGDAANKAYDKAMNFQGQGSAVFVDPETYVGSPGYYRGLAEQWGASGPDNAATRAYDRAMAFKAQEPAIFVDPGFPGYVGSKEYYENMAESLRKAPKKNKKKAYGGSAYPMYQEPTDTTSNETGTSNAQFDQTNSSEESTPPWVYGAMGAAAGPAALALGYGASQLAGPMLYPIDPDVYASGKGAMTDIMAMRQYKGNQPGATPLSYSEAAAMMPPERIGGRQAIGGLDIEEYNKMKQVYKNISEGTDEVYNELKANFMKQNKITDPKKIPLNIETNLQQQALLAASMEHASESGAALGAAKNFRKVAKLRKFTGAPIESIVNDWINETGMSKGAKAWEIMKPGKTSLVLGATSLIGGMIGWGYGAYKQAKFKGRAAEDVVNKLGENAELLDQAANNININTPNSFTPSPSDTTFTDTDGTVYIVDKNTGNVKGTKPQKRKGGSLQNSPLGYGQFNVAFGYGGQSAAPGVYDPDNVIEANQQILKGYIDAQQGNMRQGGTFQKKKFH